MDSSFVPLLLVAGVYLTMAVAQRQSGSCEPITINTCTGSGVIHQYTSVPITLPNGPGPDAGFTTYRNQKKALQGRRQLVSLLKGRKHKACREYMKPFVCAAFLPACNENGDAVPPCMELCLATKANCQVSMEDLGLEWPDELDCDVFPTRSNVPHCIAGNLVDSMGLPSKVILREVVASFDSIFVSWETEDPSTMIQGYRLEYEDGVSIMKMFDLAATESEFTITGLTPITNYVIKLRAYNFVGEGEAAMASALTKPSSEGGSTEQGSAEEGAVRLVSGYGVPHSGLVQYYKDGQWGYLCAPLVWDEDNADVVCRQLGFGPALFIASLGQMFGSGDGVGYASGSKCTGQEATLADCAIDPWDIKAGCNHYSDVGVICDTGSRETAIRLSNGTSSKGVLEVFYNNEWGTVCEEGWDVKDSEVVCRQLGYNGVKYMSSFELSFDFSFDRFISVMFKNVDCEGTEESLFDCPKSDWYVDDFSCTSHYNDVILACSKEDIDLKMRDLNVVETVSGTDVYMICSTEDVLMYVGEAETPVWTLPSGTKLSVSDSEGNVRAAQLGVSSSQLVITGFTDQQNAGIYLCTVTGYQKNVTLTEATLAVSVEFPCAEGEFNCGERCVPRRFLCDQDWDCLDGRDESEEICSQPMPIVCSRLEMLCDNDSKCVSMTALCDRIPDCDDGRDEMNCEGPVVPRDNCPIGQISCPTSDQCISLGAICDGNDDCSDGMDEMDCEDGGPIPESECPIGQIACPFDDKCILISAFCDGNEDCTDGIDEMSCGGEGGPFPPSSCPDGLIPCPTSDQCISPSAMCDGFPDCNDGIDEMACDEGGAGPFPPSSCPDGLIPCPTSDQCIPPSAMCDGFPDCNDGIDEMACGEGGAGVNNCPDGKFPCPGEVKCISISDACNGVNDCTTGVDEMNCNATSCMPISVPECAVGLDYTETMATYDIGLSPEDVANVFSSLSVIFESGCGTFFRPFICSTFVPQCSNFPLPPCRELCEVSVRKCLETFEGLMTEEQVEEQLIPQGGLGGGAGCDALPSQDDGQCYNVKEVSVGEVAGLGSEEGVGVSVDCTYNLLPGIQPKWTTPDGSKVKTGDKRRVRAIHVSDTVTRLQIDNLQPRYKGVYTCSGLEYSVTVEL
ncbi:uncharacterized protein LOC119740207 isoform X2 [Patiria miniata]|uniref:Uncharacterized protein n=1 Tax=Patiria miniata TaxID=46514 RepID=A0A914B5H7_PATMI|nr:uncharacterized protein LOC119740207 isoform X2 [Patiria miniata]